ncbi:hypothetical protein C2E23DRAFT_739951 [Lenzites betulinus]|nr:hypothetical protein C2E23DRAFT_739951 [Lenzites betulinus]
MAKPRCSGISTHDSAESKEARLDLYNLARTSTDFFYPAMREAWKVVPNVKRLTKILHIGASEPELNAWTTRRHIELRLLRFVKDTIPATKPQESPQFQRFKYYAACISQLTVCSANYLELLLDYAQQLMPSDSHDIFQSLEQLVWLETAGCFEPRRGSISHFLYAPQLSSVYLQFADPHRLSLAHMADTVHHQIYQGIVIEVAGEVSRVQRQLSHLTISVPVFISVSPLVLRGFDVQDLNLQMSIGGAGLNDINAPGIRCQPRRLELLWTQGSDYHDIPEYVSFQTLETLLVRSLDQATSSFIPAITQLAFATTENLTTVELFSIDHGTAPIYCGEFIRFIFPLVSRRHLHSLTVILHGYTFDLSAMDIDVIAGAWPGLEMLNISVSLLSEEKLPDLHHVLRVLCKRCPRLLYLHLPGLATPPGEGAIPIPRFPSSRLYHISSDVFAIQHNPMDLVYALQWSFPRLMELGPPASSTTPWAELQQLLHFQRCRDFASILEHTSWCLRNQTYAQLP